MLRHKLFDLKKWMVFAILTLFTLSTYAHVDLDNPKGGEIFSPGEVVKITWHVVIPHEQLNWDIYYSPDGGENWEVIVTDLPVSQLEYDWTVPEDITEHARVSVIQDNSTIDYNATSSDFRIQGLSPIDDLNYDKNFIIESFSYFTNSSNGSVLFNFTLNKEEKVYFEIFDLNGSLYKTLINSNLIQGDYTFELLSGRETNQLFIYRIQAGIYLKTGVFFIP